MTQRSRTQANNRIMMMDHRKKSLRRGFTLMELLVVIGIVALLSSLSIGAYFGSSMAMARGRAAAQIKMVMEQARQRACMTGQRVAVVILPARTDEAVTDNLRDKIVQFVVCAELGKLLNYSGKNCDFFGSVAEKIHSANDEFEAIDIETGLTFLVKRDGPFDNIGKVSSVYGFTKKEYSDNRRSGDFPKMTDEDGFIRVWLPISKPYNLPNGFTFSSPLKVVYNGDGSTPGNTFYVEREKKSSMDFSVEAKSDGTIKLHL